MRRGGPICASSRPARQPPTMHCPQAWTVFQALHWGLRGTVQRAIRAASARTHHFPAKRKSSGLMVRLHFRAGGERVQLRSRAVARNVHAGHEPTGACGVQRMHVDSNALLGRRCVHASTATNPLQPTRNAWAVLESRSIVQVDFAGHENAMRGLGREACVVLCRSRAPTA